MAGSGQRSGSARPGRHRPGHGIWRPRADEPAAAGDKDSDHRQPV